MSLNDSSLRQYDMSYVASRPFEHKSNDVSFLPSNGQNDISYGRVFFFFFSEILFKKKTIFFIIFWARRGA